MSGKSEQRRSIELKHSNEAIFGEIVELAKSGKSSHCPSNDNAIIWAHEEIQRLRAQAAQAQMVPLNNIQSHMMILTCDGESTEDNPEYTRALSELWDMLCPEGEGSNQNPFHKN